MSLPCTFHGPDTHDRYQKHTINPKPESGDPNAAALDELVRAAKGAFVPGEQFEAGKGVGGGAGQDSQVS